MRRHGGTLGDERRRQITARARSAMLSRPRPCWRSPTPTASPRRAAAPASSCSPTAAARMSTPTDALGARAVSRRRRTCPAPPPRRASCWLLGSTRPISPPSPAIGIATPDEITFDAAERSVCGRAASAGSAPSCSMQPRSPSPADRRRRSDPGRRPRRASASARLPWSKGTTATARSRRVSARQPMPDAWPDLSDAALADNRRRLARPVSRRQDAARRYRRRRSRSARSTRCCPGT